MSAHGGLRQQLQLAICRTALLLTCANLLRKLEEVWADSRSPDQATITVVAMCRRGDRRQAEWQAGQRRRTCETAWTLRPDHVKLVASALPETEWRTALGMGPPSL